MWPFADTDPLPGTALLAGWLGRTIITLVTRYTSPGDRVLLLSPPTPPRSTAQLPNHTLDRDPYAGLTEAVWTVTRLGRNAETASRGETDPTAHSGEQSESRPRPCRLGLHPPTAPFLESEGRLSRAACRPSRRFDLIITTVDPRATDWLVHTDWSADLAPNGLVAAVTHSRYQGSRLLDPLSVIATTFRHHHLRFVDHIAVLDSPESPTERGAATPLPLRTVHHDLVLFGPVATSTVEARRGATSDV